MTRQTKIVAFFTDDEGRIRPITAKGLEHQELKQRTQEIKEKLRKQRKKEPKSIRQAVIMLANKELEYRPSYTLMREYDELNRKYFKGRLPEAAVVLVHLPKVRHKGFCIREARMIVINTAKADTLEKQINTLKHEMIHMAGIDGHGFWFRFYAKKIGAPVMDTEEGDFIYAEDYERLMVEREAERERREMEEREKIYGAKKGEGTRIIEGKPAARVLCWIYPNGKLVIPMRNVTDERQIPKKAEKVELILFDKLGYPKPKTITVDRKDVSRYYIVP